MQVVVSKCKTEMLNTVPSKSPQTSMQNLIGFPTKESATQTQDQNMCSLPPPSCEDFLSLLGSDIYSMSPSPEPTEEDEPAGDYQ